jgi:prophage regulatory protein
MRNTGSSAKNQAEKNGPDNHPEASLPPLCRLEHVLTVVPIARSTVWLWVRQGRFPKPFKFGSITLWNRGDVLTWLKRAGGEP